MAFNGGEFLQCKLPNGKIINLYIPQVKVNLTNGQTINLANFKNRIVELVDRRPMSVLGGYVYLDNNIGNINKISNVIANNQYTFSYAWRNFANLPAMYKQILSLCNDGGYAQIFLDYMKSDYNTSYQYLTCPILVDGVQTNYNIYIRYRWVRTSNPTGINTGFFDSQYAPGATYSLPASKPQYYYIPTIQYSFNNQTSWLGTENGEIIVRDHDTGKIFVLAPQQQESLLGNDTSWYTVLDNTVTYLAVGSTQFTLLDTKAGARFNLAYAYDRSSYFSAEIKAIINNNLEESSPYSGNGTNEPTITSGSYDGSSEDVNIDSAPTDIVLSSDLLKAYLPDGTVLSNLHSYLFSSGYVDNLIKALKSPFDAIIKLHNLPISITGAADTIKLGNLDSGINCDRTTTRYIDVDLGNLYIEGYYGLFNDYISRYDLYLPYLNIISLPADEVINATLNVTYRVDILSGDFVAYVVATKTNARGYDYSAIIYTGAGNMASDIPITQSNTMGLIGALNNGFSAGSAGNILQAFNAGVEIGIGGAVDYGVKGGLSSNSGRLAKATPYIRECIPNVMLPAKFSELMGFRSEITGAIGSFSGLCKFRSFKIDFGTYDERGAIEALLQAGVYVDSGASIVTTHDLVLLNNSSDDRTLGKTKTVIAEIDGDYRDFVPVNELVLDIDIAGYTLSSFNYIYIKDLDRYYFIREKTMLNESICRVVLTCDPLESFASSIKSITAICERAESSYYTNPLLHDESIPVQVNNIVKYHNFAAGLTSSSMVLIVI